jgi:DNA invertase Pin-like site-specific DNA recombinase
LKITPSHLARQAIVYLRQSSPSQVEHNRESTERQYALAARARELGWPEERIVVIDEDLGLSGSGVVTRSGFARLTAEVALARVGLVLGLEVSRLARNNADWHRLIDLAGLTDTLIGDGDGIYHPAAFNDRLLLGLKGTMSEAELHVLRARLNGGIRNKAARGELRRGLPTGFVWGEADGEVLLHPDEAVVTAIGTIFDRFAEMGSARRVWLWLRDQGLKLPLQMHAHADIRWVDASYHAVHQVLANPVYAGAYVYGKTRTEVSCSAPHPRIGTLALAVGAACGLSLHAAQGTQVADGDEVLTFRTKAWSKFAPPTRRMPLGRYQDILRADPGSWVSPRF